MKIHKNILEIYAAYDGFFVDVHGVLCNGIKMYDGVCDTLRILKDSGKKVIILSNTTNLSSESIEIYRKKGLNQGVHFDEFITSGNVLRNSIMNREYPFDARSAPMKYKQIFAKHPTIFNGSGMTEVESIDDADFIYIGVPKTWKNENVFIDHLYDMHGNNLSIDRIISYDWNFIKNNEIQSFSYFSSILEKCLEASKPLICANSDIFASEMRSGNDIVPAPVIRQGCIAAYYKKMGGNVFHYGKPNEAIYNEAFKKINLDKSKLVMIGDTPWTDIAGAKNVGIDSILTLTGTFEVFSKYFCSDLVDQFLNDFSRNISSNNSFSLVPTMIISAF